MTIHVPIAIVVITIIVIILLFALWCYVGTKLFDSLTKWDGK